jgi:nicotinamide phosphoribosyltransferase
LLHKKTEKGGLMVLRPDSGDPEAVVLEALAAAEKVVGATKNKKGYKLINGLSVIQGDGVNYSSIRKIINHFIASGYSAANVAFGMGGGLLQKVNRDTMSFATKLSYIRTPDGKTRDIMKKPKSDPGKVSLPGILKVKKSERHTNCLPFIRR